METYIGQSGTFSLMKQLNLEKVYKIILLKHPISRISISEISGLNKVTVSNCVDFLINHGVIVETGVSKPSGGRPAILLDLNKDFGVFIGVEYNTISSIILVTDIEGNILHKSKMSGKIIDPKEFIDQTISAIKFCDDRYNNTRMGILGVCMATTNNYNPNTGVVEDIVGRPEWHGFPIRQYLQERLEGVPLLMQHVSTAATLGEIHFGNSGPLQHLAYLYGAWGLNLTMYESGNIYEGSEGFSGRFGHTVIEAGGRQCVCGNKGCLEAYASLHALMERLYPEERDRLAWDQPYRLELFNLLKKRLSNKDPEVMEAIHELSDYLALGIVNIVNIYNPAQVCIGGYLSTIIDDEAIVYINNKICKLLPKHLSRNLTLSCSNLAEYASVFGCVSVVRNRLIDILVTHEKKMGYLDALNNL